MPNQTLFLTQSAPPRPGAAARRIQHLVQAAQKEGHEVHLIRGDRNYPGEEITGVHLHKIPLQDVRRVVQSVDKKGGLFPLLKHRLGHLRQLFPFVYLTDDGGPAYRKAAFDLADNLIQTKSINRVFSSFRPWSDHLVASRLKKKYPHLHWTADFRDLPVDTVRDRVWWPALQTWWGRRIIRHADEVWCVSEGQRAQLRGWHPNIKVVRNALLKLPPEQPPVPTERFCIVYTGSVYPGLQTIAPLVKALQSLLRTGALASHELLLQYRGKDHEQFTDWCRGLPAESLDIQPIIAPAASQKLQAEANLLLLLNWSAPGYYGILTAKLWDYLATGRQILALVNGPGDEELQDIIAGAAAGAVFRTEEQSMVEQYLSTAVAEWKALGYLDQSIDREALRQHLP